MKNLVLLSLLSFCLFTPSLLSCDGITAPTTQESTLSVPVKAVIKGPTEVLAGTLLFLSNEDAVGDNKVWLITDELKQQSASCGSNIFFAIPKPGKYQFGLIVANREAQIDYAWHTVTVLPFPGTPPTTDPPTGPVDPPPSSLLQEITAASREGVTKLSDPTTAVALREALTAVLPQLSPSLPEAQRQATTAIETTLLFRSPVSRTKDWLNLWRVPIQNVIKKSPPQTTDDYRKMVQAMIAGLQ